MLGLNSGKCPGRVGHNYVSEIDMPTAMHWHLFTLRKWVVKINPWSSRSMKLEDDDILQNSLHKRDDDPTPKNLTAQRERERGRGI